MKYPANYLTDEYSLDSGNALYAGCHQVEGGRERGRERGRGEREGGRVV